MNETQNPSESEKPENPRISETTLRDLIAAKAMAAYIGGPSNQDCDTARGNVEMVAGWAYQHADAMLKARASK